MQPHNDPPVGRGPGRFSPIVGSAPTRTAAYPALPPRLVPGDRVREFRVVREICCGKHASVFAAENVDTGRRVALKVLSPQLREVPEAVERFRREAMLAERVRHPSLVPLFGTGEDADYHYHVLRLESGTTLEDLAYEAPFHRETSFYLSLATRFAGVARAAHALHVAGIIHRDIKPANILVDDAGEFLLTDFGSALERDADFDPSKDSVGGTVLYMSPEQLFPGADPRDPAGDIYSLGATLYELVVGSPPFPRLRDAELARLKITRLPLLPSRVNPFVPLTLDAIIRRAMSPERALRPRSAEDLAHDLERYSERRRRGSSRSA
jgi:serine/threonine protein kinase